MNSSIKLTAILLTPFLTQSLSAQFILGDPDGESTLLFLSPNGKEKKDFLGGTGLYTFDYAKAKASIGGFWEKNDTSRGADGTGSYAQIDQWMFSPELTVTSSNGFKGLFKDGDVAGDIALDFYLGYRPGQKIYDGDDDFANPSIAQWDQGWWTLRFGVSRSRFTLLDFQDTVSPAVANEYNTLFNVGVNYTFAQTTKNNKFWGGIGLGYRRTSNYDSLEDRTFVDTFTTVGGGAFIGDETVVRDSNEFEVFNEGYLNFDLFFVPNAEKIRIFKHTLATNLFVRTAFRDDDTLISSGLGLYFVDPEDPTDMTVGFSVIYDDEENDFDYGLMTKFEF